MKAVILIEEGEPESGWWRLTFTRESGVFTETDLKAVQQTTRGVGGFSGSNHAQIFLVSNKGYLRAQLPAAALRVLKRRYPQASFTTYVDSVKRLLGDAVEQVKRSRK